jgi:hypothetical protein
MVTFTAPAVLMFGTTLSYKQIAGLRWGYLHNRWFMFQWAFDFTLSFGVHIDPVRRGKYGPYLDIHLLVCALSVGNNPALANNYSLMRPLWQQQQ